MRGRGSVFSLSRLRERVGVRVSQRIQSSCPDLIRASINLHKILAKKMDGRVKPGHDE
jgi:hypothetical protein